LTITFCYNASGSYAGYGLATVTWANENPSPTVGASVATTASFYGHVRPSMLRQSADRMDAVMRTAAGT
jgi:hypothetical protein